MSHFKRLKILHSTSHDTKQAERERPKNYEKREKKEAKSSHLVALAHK
jgi:hypothetical protein